MQKILLILIISFISTLNGFSQIEIGNKKENDRKKEQKMKDEVEGEIEKKKKKKKPLSITGRNVYLGTSLGQSFRTLEPSDNIFSRPLDQKVDEEFVFSYRVAAGMQVIMFKHFMVDFGFTYSEQGEKYSFEDDMTDSTYSYRNRYRYIGVPITVNATFGGERFRFYFGGGFVPMMFINQGQELTYTTMDGTRTEEKITFRDNNYNQFNIMAIGRLGINFNLSKHVGFYMAPEFRYVMLNTFYDQYKHNHHQWAWGVDFGFLLFL